MPAVSSPVPRSQLSWLHLPPPPAVMLSMKDCRGGLCQCLVKKGQSVLQGQCIGLPVSGGAAVHASVSGIVRAVSPGAVVIENDFHDTPAADAAALAESDMSALSSQISEAGLLTADGLPLLPGTACRVLVLSLLPRDPGVPDPLQMYAADRVFAGLRLARQLWSPASVVILRDRRCLTSGVLARSFGGNAEIISADGRYPGGKFHTLRRRLWGNPGRDTDILILDAQSAAGIYDAVYLGQPYISKLMVLTGPSLPQPLAVNVPLGTAEGHVLSAAGIPHDSTRPVDKTHRLLLPFPGK